MNAVSSFIFRAVSALFLFFLFLVMVYVLAFSSPEESGQDQGASQIASNRTQDKPSDQSKHVRKFTLGSKIESLISLAKSKLGSKYVTGKAGPDTFDCSGFVYYIFKEQGKFIPRTSIAQSKIGKKLDRVQIKRGDILFFDTSDKHRVNHSGIYLGDDRFIHASSGKAYSVTISSLDGWYKDKFLWGVRVFDQR